MPAFAAKHGWDFPYLVDEDQSVAKAYGAVCTPDFFGYNADLTLQYRGRLDDARMGDAANRVPELLNAMQQIAETGTGPVSQSASMGCTIKWRKLHFSPINHETSYVRAQTVYVRIVHGLCTGCVQR